MPTVTDFRTLPLSLAAIDNCAKFVGKKSYWKLYAIENIFRILIHSVLSAQFGATWWTTATDQNIQRRTQNSQNRYINRPWHTQPGTHDIYHSNLSDLSEIMRVNSQIFYPILPDVDQWIVRIQQVLLPRNIIGHMNCPNAVDRQRIDVLYSDCRALIAHLQRTNLQLVIPN
jgi:hypothetical protein